MMPWIIVAVIRPRLSAGVRWAVYEGTKYGVTVASPSATLATKNSSIVGDHAIVANANTRTVIERTTIDRFSTASPSGDRRSIPRPTANCETIGITPM